MGLTQLVSQTASSGTWRDSQLVLTGVSPVTVVYSDGAHKAYSLETTELVGIWHDTFGATPVTAAVQLSGGADDQHTVLVHVSNPAYDPKRGALQFDADDTNVEATGGLASFASTTDPLPATFGAATLFLDASKGTLPEPSSTDAPKVKPCASSAATWGPHAVKMSVVNKSSYDDDLVYVTLTGKVLDGYQSWDTYPRDLINTSVPLSCLPKDPTVPGGHVYSFQMSKGVSAGLLWVSLGVPIETGLPDTQPSFDTTDYRFANVEIRLSRARRHDERRPVQFPDQPRHVRSQVDEGDRVVALPGRHVHGGRHAQAIGARGQGGRRRFRGRRL